jgi:MFS family permease
MWGIMILTYMFNTFHAVAMGVLKEDLIGEFQMSEDRFVLITNAFGYTYMLMQIPVGLLLDKIGAKKVALLGNAAAGLGVFIFAFADSSLALFCGRALIGFGCSVCFLSVLKICVAWFDEKTFCTLSGLTTMIGMIGAMFAQTPLAYLVGAIGWRRCFTLFGLITFAVVGLIALFVKDRPQVEELATAAERPLDFSVFNALKMVLKNRYTWPPFFAFAAFYGTYLVLTGLYGTEMMRVFYNISTVEAASYLFYAVLGCAIGGVVIAVISDRLANRRFTQVVAGGGFIACWILFRYTLGDMQLSYLKLVMFGLGFFSCAYSVVWSSVKEVNDPNYVGLSTSLANIGGYFGIVLVPTIAGRIYSVGSAAGPQADAFLQVINVVILINILGVVAAFFVRETYGRNIHAQLEDPPLKVANGLE